LTVQQLRKLRNDLIAKALERKRGQVRPNTPDLDQVKNPDSEAERRAKVNSNRVMAMLKAALNRAYNELENGIYSDTAWRRVSPFKGVNRARDVHLDQEQCQRLITVAGRYIPKQSMRTGMKPILHPNAFQNLVIATLLTGARPAPGEIAQARVKDFRADLATLSIFKSKTGPRVIVLTKEAVSFFESLSADRNPDDLLLPNYYGLDWGYNQQIRPMGEAVRLAELPAGTCMYSLRHTYASQSIMSGMNLKLLAENMGTSIRMLEEHYAKFLQGKKRKLIEETSFKLGLTPSNVTAMRPRKIA
jgi:integrase